MLIRIMENGKFVRATHIKDYDRFLSMLRYMKGKDIKIGEEWYTFEGDYLLNFPETDDNIMTLDVFVCGY